MRELQREGKIRAWGAAFGPAIGWRDEGIYGAGARKAGTVSVATCWSR